MSDNSTLPEVVSNYPRETSAVKQQSLELGRELLKAYYQCAQIAFTMVGWFVGTLLIVASCTPLGAPTSVTVALLGTCLLLTAWHLNLLVSQPLSALALAGGRSEQFVLRWKAAICLLGPLGLGLGLLSMLRSRIITQLEPYGIADDLSTFQEREVFVLLSMHCQSAPPQKSSIGD